MIAASNHFLELCPTLWPTWKTIFKILCMPMDVVDSTTCRKKSLRMSPETRLHLRTQNLHWVTFQTDSDRAKYSNPAPRKWRTPDSEVRYFKEENSRHCSDSCQSGGDVTRFKLSIEHFMTRSLSQSEFCPCLVWICIMENYCILIPWANISLQPPGLLLFLHWLTSPYTSWLWD